jgi:exosortase
LENIRSHWAYAQKQWRRRFGRPLSGVSQLENTNFDNPGSQAKMPWSNVMFGVGSILSLALLHGPIGRLASLAAHDDRYSHILLIPFLSLYLMWLSRSKILSSPRDGLALGLPLLLAGIGLSITVGRVPFPKSQDLSFSASILGLVLVLTGEFIWCFGRQAFRAAIFPLFLLFLIIPIPIDVMDKAVLELQKGSADISYFLFKLVGVPVFRDGFRFSLPGVDIEVAAECSGIRSSLSLFLSSLLVGHLTLESGWSRAAFTLLTIPVVIFKNAVRIVTISWLGVYVDPGFFHGNLHRYGGLPFSLLAIVILFFVLVALRKTEMLGSRADSRGTLLVAGIK